MDDVTIYQNCVKSVCNQSFSGPNVGKYEAKKLQARTLFTQCNVKTYAENNE